MPGNKIRVIHTTIVPADSGAILQIFGSKGEMETIRLTDAELEELDEQIKKAKKATK